MEKKESKLKNDKEMQQIILMIIASIVLFIIAAFLYIKRNAPEPEPEPEEEPIVETKPAYVNSYCDTNRTLGTNQEKYAPYIYISALDEEGCALVNDDYNKNYIWKKQVEAASIADKKISTLEIPSGSSIKTGTTKIVNANGNVLGWTIQAYYGSGVQSSKYILTLNDEWVTIE